MLYKVYSAYRHEYAFLDTVFHEIAEVWMEVVEMAEMVDLE